MIARHAIVAAVLLVATLACAPPPSAEDEGKGEGEGWQAALARAETLGERDDHEGAQFVLRRAIRDDPEQPLLHLALARTGLALERTDLALTSIDDAAEAGADIDAVALLRADTYYAAADLAALEAMAKGPPLTAPTGALLRYQEARLLAEAPYSIPERVFERFFALFRHLDGLDARTRQRLREAGLDQGLAALRSTHGPAEQAWAQVRCADAPVPPTRYWEPAAVAAERRVLRVGKGAPYTTVAAAAAAARDGDVVEITDGDYVGDVVFWPQNRLLIRGTGGRPHIRGAGRRVRDRDVWLFRGDDIVVENVEISGARSPQYRNGAAIRHIGKHLTLRHVFLHDSENGLLIGNDHPDSRVLIEHSEFARNGSGDGLTHNVYVGLTGELIFRYSYSHDGNGGHLLKSRAASTQVHYSRLSDEQGRSSYLIDTPNGGEVSIVGNVLEKNAKAQNKYAMSYAGEGLTYPRNEMWVVNNSMYNRAYNGLMVHLYTRSRTRVLNNVAVGAPTGLVDTEHVGFVIRDANVLAVDHGLRDPAKFDFSLTNASPAIDGGEAHARMPTHEYVHPLGFRPRGTINDVDIGAYEACRGRLVGEVEAAP